MAQIWVAPVWAFQSWATRAEDGELLWEWAAVRPAVGIAPPSAAGTPPRWAPAASGPPALAAEAASSPSVATSPVESVESVELAESVELVELTSLAESAVSFEWTESFGRRVTGGKAWEAAEKAERSANRRW